MSSANTPNPAGDDRAGDDTPERYPVGFRFLPDDDLRELVRKIWRRKMAVIGTTIMGTTLAAIIVVQQTPRYTATTAIMLESRETRVVDMEEVVSGLPQDLETVQSEIGVIRSRGLAERVIHRLKLNNDPEFNPPPPPKSLWDELIDPKTFLPEEWIETFLAEEWIDIVFDTSNEEPITEEERLDRERVRIIDTLLASLKVRPRGRSRIIDISFESENARTAALVANTVADLYLLEQLEVKFDATQRATVWLGERLAEIRQEVTASERAVEAFRKQVGLTKGKSVTLVFEQLSELNMQLILARSERVEVSVRLREVEVMLQSTGGVESVGEVLSSSLIQSLRQQEASVQRRVAELASRSARQLEK